MSQSKVYKKFELYFPQFATHVESWYPNGKNSVRIRQTNKQDFIFTFNSEKDWKFETVERFLNDMKGAK